ncbi:uncharacterized protein [Spinacia oleracea]|uniref:Transposase n=1 Tax=Spinacia oleracea TaxID=3562 RepID=A0ABM3QIM4_SPIOL|nr:uncharacterized protein LOC130459723 [Spinacia oleracea]
MDDYSVEELLELEELLEFDPDMEVWYSDDESENDEEVENSAVLNNDNQIPIRNLGGRTTQSRELTDFQRKHMIDKLLLLANDELKIPPRAQIEIALEFNVYRTTVWRYWSKAKIRIRRGETIDVKGQKPGKVGRKCKDWDLDRLHAIPVEKRTTIRKIADALDIHPSTVYKLIKSGKIRACSSSLKPSVTPTHKIARIAHVLRQIIPRNVNTPPKFSAMYNVIHIDEKWFYMSQKSQKFYLFPWEDEPYRACQNKNYIPKMMFMGCVARPILGTNGEILWDGKIGMFPFTYTVEAQRSSKNRDRGTPETKAIVSITREVIRAKLIEEVLPAIMAKWPANACKEIWIQQDNAKPHISVDDAEFRAAATKNGFKIRLTCQPAQSPDLNVLDLGFFRAIQSLQYKAFPKDTKELLKSVEDAFQAYEPRLVNYNWLHLQYCMLEILKVEGSNKYKNPHNKKHAMDRLGILPTQVEVPEELIEESRKILARGPTN